MDTQLVVGIDVGGQTTKLGVVDARGTVLAQTVIRTDTYDTVEPYIDELAEALKKIIREAGAEGNVRGIGVGAPNGNYYTGSIADAPNIAWGRNGTIPFAKLLSAKMTRSAHHRPPLIYNFMIPHPMSVFSDIAQLFFFFSAGGKIAPTKTGFKGTSPFPRAQKTERKRNLSAA